ncbi:fimbrial protein [Cupriavidus campinensis]
MRDIIRRITIILVIGLGLAAGSAMATCRQITDAEILEWTEKGLPDVSTMSRLLRFNVTFPTSRVEVEPDLPIGSVLATGVSDVLGANTAILSCDWSGGRMLWRYEGQWTPSQFSDVMATGIKGIGIRQKYVRGSGSASALPYESVFQSGAPGTPYFPTLRAGVHMLVELIKTGEMNASSTFAGGWIGSAKGDGDGVTVVSVTSSAVTIEVKPSCSVSTPNQNIDFGTFGPNDVSLTAGPTRRITFDLNCTGPTAPRHIFSRVAGTPDAVNSSLLQNTGAQYLGIRIRDAISQTILRPNDLTSLLYTAGGGKKYTFNLDATVLRVGTQTPTAGVINATAVLMISIN